MNRIALVLAFFVLSRASAAQGHSLYPPENPYAPEKALLGKALFWDEQLSSTRTVACGTCHVPEFGGGDPRTLLQPIASTNPGHDRLFGTADDTLGSPGVRRTMAGGAFEPSLLFGFGRQVTSRKAPTVVNAAKSETLFWDGRAESTFRDPLTGEVVIASGGALESQAVAPPVSAVEMGHEGISWADVVARIEGLEPLVLATDIPPTLAGFVVGRTYGELFDQVFGSPGVTPTRLAFAIATYERDLISEAKIDSIPVGFTPEELMGADVFDQKANCVACHNVGAQITSDYRRIGLVPPGEDAGRFAVTGDSEDLGKFRVPDLRNVRLRGPYFHNGAFQTLEDVIEFYDRGGDFEHGQDPLIEPIGLTQAEKDALVAYLDTFTDPRLAKREAPFDRPTLFSESQFVPKFFGKASPSQAGLVPRPIASQPPSVRNPSFTVGLRNAFAGAPAALIVGTKPFVPGASVPGSTLYVDLSKQSALIPIHALAVDPAGFGFGSVTLDLTLLGPGAVGLHLFGQWLITDPATGLFAATRAFELELF